MFPSALAMADCTCSEMVELLSFSSVLRGFLLAGLPPVIWIVPLPLVEDLLLSGLYKLSYFTFSEFQFRLQLRHSGLELTGDRLEFSVDREFDVFQHILVAL